MVGNVLNAVGDYADIGHVLSKPKLGRCWYFSCWCWGWWSIGFPNECVANICQMERLPGNVGDLPKPDHDPPRSARNSFTWDQYHWQLHKRLFAWDLGSDLNDQFTDAYQHMSEWEDLNTWLIPRTFSEPSSKKIELLTENCWVTLMHHNWVSYF